MQSTATTERVEVAGEDSIAADKLKTASAFRTIGEVAADLGLPPHVLRFWESKFPQIKPHKRRGGHRYYRPADIEFLKELKSLLHERGYTIKGAQKYLKERKQDGTSSQQAVMFVDQAANPQPTISAADLGRKDIHRLKKVLNGLEEIKAMLEKNR